MDSKRLICVFMFAYHMTQCCTCDSSSLFKQTYLMEGQQKHGRDRFSTSPPFVGNSVIKTSTTTVISQGTTHFVKGVPHKFRKSKNLESSTHRNVLEKNRIQNNQIGLQPGDLSDFFRKRGQDIDRSTLFSIVPKDYLKNHFLTRSTKKPLLKRCIKKHLLKRSTKKFENLSPCSYHNREVDCSGQSLTELEPAWFPVNTTKINLDNNLLTTLPSFVFSHLSALETLSVANNRLKHINTSTFHGLLNLKILNLADNFLILSDLNFRKEVFDPLIQLKELFLNTYKTETDIFGKKECGGNHGAVYGVLATLRQLRSLSITVCGERLYLVPEFLNCSNLSTLRIFGGGLQSIDNRSFENVRYVRELSILDAKSLKDFNIEALGHLNKLMVLEIQKVSIGTKRSLQILEPLKGQKMNRINYRRVQFKEEGTYHTRITGDDVLTINDTKYLTTICLQHFAMTDCDIRVVQKNAFSGDGWNRCLQTLDLSGNPLAGTLTTLVQILNSKSLESIYLKVFNIKHYLRYQISEYPEEPPDSSSDFGIMKSLLDIKNSNLKTNKTLSNRQHNEILDLPCENVCKPLNSSCRNILKTRLSNEISFYIGKSLRSLHMSRSYGIIIVNHNYNITYLGAENIVYVDQSMCGLSHFTGRIFGLENLITFILSGNDMRIVSPNFFDTFCGLEHLYLSNCEMMSDFMSGNSGRLFQNLPEIKVLDLSYNMLDSLATDTFQRNNQLQALILARNRFKSIPFNLKHTPRLKFMDLRENAVASLPSFVLDRMDSLANRNGFHLLLAGNRLSCDCKSLRFLHWLQVTRVQLDLHRNYSCLNESAQPDNMDSYQDLMDLWRRCWGVFFLYLAVSFLLLLTISFLCAFLLWKHQIFIKSFAMKILTGHRLKLRSDYRTDVYIGYAEADYRFPKYELNTFIEEELGLKTYLYHRDMLLHEDMATSVVQALNQSWRILLVFSERFLSQDDQWSTFTFKSAMYAQTTENPDRILVLVDKQLQHRLPLEVLSSVPDERVVVISNWTLTRDVRQRLKHCLI